MKRNYDFTDKWTPLIAQSGHTALPNLLIKHQADLGITPSEMVVIIGLLANKWSRSDPFPSAKTLSKQSGLAVNTVRTHIRNLEQKGLIKRRFRQGTSNEYSFEPMIKCLERYAPNPTQKRTPSHSNMDNPPYSKLDTKEETVFINTKRKRRNYSHKGKPTALSEILNERYRSKYNANNL